MKGRILQILRESRDIVSGETLSDRLGISRVSVWKHMQKLQACGYGIEAGPSGYRVVSDPDIPYPWEFPDSPARIVYFSEVTSTMDIAREKAGKGCPDFTVVAAGRQTRGRGRLDRVWASAEGGIYLTVVLRPNLAPARSPRIGFAASLSLAATLMGMFDIPARVKWPNDILVNGKKVAGILAEMESDTDRVIYLNIGIGLNVNNDPRTAEPSATSLALVLGQRASKKAVFGRFIDTFHANVHLRPLDDVVRRWKQYAATLNQNVRVKTLGETVEGVARDVDDDGALMVETAGGSVRRVLYGDCIHG